MDTKKQWNDLGWCFRNAEVLRKVGMTAAAEAWQERGEQLMSQQFKPANDMFSQILDMVRPAGHA